MRDRPMRDRGARRALATVALIAVTFIAPVAPVEWAGAERVTSDELRALAERAASDPASLTRLRGVDQVDGRPVDLGRALAGAEGEDLRSRLRTLAAGPGGGPGPGAAATSPSDEARAILDGRKFKPAPAIRPFRGVLRQLGDWLRPIGRPLARFWDRVAGNTPGRVLLVIAVIGAAALATMALIRRRSTGGVSRAWAGRERKRVEDPDELEREADAAELAGELERAFRLRFRAGLLRLDRAGVIAYRPALTTGELTRRVQSPRLHGLASAFEEIAYGGRPVGTDDLQSARADWPRVLQEVGER